MNKIITWRKLLYMEKVVAVIGMLHGKRILKKGKGGKKGKEGANSNI